MRAERGFYNDVGPTGLRSRRARKVLGNACGSCGALEERKRSAKTFAEGDKATAPQSLASMPDRISAHFGIVLALERPHANSSRALPHHPIADPSR